MVTEGHLIPFPLPHPKKGLLLCRQEPTSGLFCLLLNSLLKLCRQRKLSTRNALQVIRERELEILENDQQTTPKFETGVEKHEETVSVYLVLFVLASPFLFKFCLPLTVLPFLRHTFLFDSFDLPFLGTPLTSCDSFTSCCCRRESCSGLYPNPRNNHEQHFTQAIVPNQILSARNSDSLLLNGRRLLWCTV